MAIIKGSEWKKTGDQASEEWQIDPVTKKWICSSWRRSVTYTVKVDADGLDPKSFNQAGNGYLFQSSTENIPYGATSGDHSETWIIGGVYNPPVTFG